MTGRRPILAGALALTLAGCGGPLALLGGGPKVAANVQAGRTNAQTIGETRVADNRIERVTAGTITQTADTNRVRADRVERIVVQEIPPWVALLALLGWLVPSPGEVARMIRRRLGWAE